MESSIAVFLMRWVACELPPTVEDKGEGQSIFADLLLCPLCVQMSSGFRFAPIHFPVDVLGAYLLGLLAMIKCSICSYQCDN